MPSGLPNSYPNICMSTLAGAVVCTVGERG